MAGMTLDESARRLGALAGTERRLFEVLGGWVRQTPDPARKVAVAVRARRHASRALALEAVLPETRDHDPASFVVPPAPAAAVLEALAGGEATEDRLGALRADVIVEHMAALEAWLRDASPVRDGPGARAVATVLAEERAELAGSDPLTG